MSSILVRVVHRTEAHDTMSIFVGPDPDHRAHCGQLVMRRDEATAFRSALVAGQGTATDSTVELAITDDA